MPFMRKVYEGIFLLAAFELVAVLHPKSEMADSQVMIRFWIIAIAYLSCHYYFAHRPQKQELFSAQMAMAILVASFLLEIVNQGSNIANGAPGEAKGALLQVLKAGFFASIGLAAAGGFQTQTHLVHKVSHEILLANERLKMLELALQGTETAIAITNDNYQIIWSNAAFEAMSGTPVKPSTTLSDCIQLDDVTKRRFLACFKDKETQVLPVALKQDKYFRVIVSPFQTLDTGMKDNGSRFMVIFNE